MESAEQRWLSSNNHNNEREKKTRKFLFYPQWHKKQEKEKSFFFATISPGSSGFKKNALVIASCGAFFACAVFNSIVCEMCEIRFSLRKHFDWQCKMIERIECCERPCPIPSMMCDHQIKCLISPAFACYHSDARFTNAHSIPDAYHSPHEHAIFIDLLTE